MARAVLLSTGSGRLTHLGVSMLILQDHSHIPLPPYQEPHSLQFPHQAHTWEHLLP